MHIKDKALSQDKHLNSSAYSRTSLQVKMAGPSLDSAFHLQTTVIYRIISLTAEVCREAFQVKNKLSALSIHSNHLSNSSKYSF